MRCCAPLPLPLPLINRDEEEQMACARELLTSGLEIGAARLSSATK